MAVGIELDWVGLADSLADWRMAGMIPLMWGLLSVDDSDDDDDFDDDVGEMNFSDNNYYGVDTMKLWTFIAKWIELNFSPHFHISSHLYSRL